MQSPVVYDLPQSVRRVFPDIATVILGHPDHTGTGGATIPSGGVME